MIENSNLSVHLHIVCGHCHTTITEFGVGVAGKIKVLIIHPFPTYRKRLCHSVCDGQNDKNAGPLD